jgi:hypothetical protein
MGKISINASYLKFDTFKIKLLTTCITKDCHPVLLYEEIKSSHCTLALY